MSHIAGIIQASPRLVRDDIVEYLLLDSRKTGLAAESVFFALKGFRRNGHQFIPDLYKKGVRNFVVSEDKFSGDYPDANFLLVQDTLHALQELAAFHRGRFNIPVIGITGSNGKTIVKEWLYQLLRDDFNIVRSPGSYNSQVGVPLSIWQMDASHSLAIFEAGISKPGEMEKLERMIRPTIGVLTNIGEAHSEGFSSAAEKEREKRILFRQARIPAPLLIHEINKGERRTVIRAQQNDPGSGILAIDIPFTDEASVQNAVTCWQVLLDLGYENSLIAGRMKQLQPVNMRLELIRGIQGCSVINDSYSADTRSLEIALGFLEQQAAGSKKTVILSDFLQTGIPGRELYPRVLASLEKHGVSRLIGIGEQIGQYIGRDSGPDLETAFFPSTEDFIQHYRFSTFRDECILVKGARVFAFERIARLLEQKAHETVLEVNLSALVHNLKAYQQRLHPETRVMAMVKAFAYGSGGAEIAGILQYHNVDYLGVAYADEGVELRKAGIRLPVMVMNPDPGSFSSILQHRLEPEIYSFAMLQKWESFLASEGVQQYPVHIEIETGMNRLGFAAGDMEKLAKALKQSASVRVRSVFTHLAASEEEVQDSFTLEQFRLFETATAVFREQLGYDVIRHIANSAAVVRHPQLQMDMVRLGIGLYGIDSAASGKLSLQPVATLRTTIAQVRHLKKGESVSYNRRGMITKDTVVATVRIGYADGYPRRLGNGRGRVWIRGQLAPVIGTVCMDMFMIDITGIPEVKDGDEVIIFGEKLPVQQLAEWADTIPYEIMTGISQRVRRVYYQE